MSLTVVNWPLIICLIGVLALIALQHRAKKAQRETFDSGIRKAFSEAGDAARTPAAPSEAAAAEGVQAAARSVARADKSAGRQVPDWLGGSLAVPVMAFALVAGVGAASSLWRHQAIEAGETFAAAPSPAAPDNEAIARLADYAQSIAPEPAGGVGAATANADMLPDVSTMIQRLAARLKAAPDDADGWKMLGWSYFNTGHYGEAASAYKKAVALDPGSAELRLAYGEASAKAGGGSDLYASQAPQQEAGGASAAAAPTQAPMMQGERGAAIRSMVDRLADRLESSPRDVEGWMRLMRSRVVLGERAVAATALRKALNVFKDDAVASGKLTAAASELGLEAD